MWRRFLHAMLQLGIVKSLTAGFIYNSLKNKHKSRSEKFLFYELLLALRDCDNRAFRSCCCCWWNQRRWRLGMMPMIPSHDPKRMFIMYSQAGPETASGKSVFLFRDETKKYIYNGWWHFRGICNAQKANRTLAQHWTVYRWTLQHPGAQGNYDTIGGQIQC